MDDKQLDTYAKIIHDNHHACDVQTIAGCRMLAQMLLDSKGGSMPETEQPMFTPSVSTLQVTKDDKSQPEDGSQNRFPIIS
jgi:hypothetical protein